VTDDRDRDQAPPDEPDPLLEELRRIASIVDPVPERAIEAGQAAFAWRTFDAEFAALVHDSLAVAAPAGVRSDEEPPLLLTFESEHLLVEVKVIRVGAERELVGQLVAAADAGPGRVAGVELVAEHANGPTTVESDQRGRFVAAGIAAGPVRLRCRPPQPAPEVVTDWVTL
jgi:hypothetical protein